MERDTICLFQKSTFYYKIFMCIPWIEISATITPSPVATFCSGINDESPKTFFLELQYYSFLGTPWSAPIIELNCIFHKIILPQHSSVMPHFSFVAFLLPQCTHTQLPLREKLHFVCKCMLEYDWSINLHVLGNWLQ